MGVGLGLPLRPSQVQVTGLRMGVPPNIFADRRRMGGLFRADFRPEPQTNGYFAGQGYLGGWLELLLLPARTKQIGDYVLDLIPETLIR
jgi:hypothetical protein